MPQWVTGEGWAGQSQRKSAVSVGCARDTSQHKVALQQDEEDTSTTDGDAGSCGGESDGGMALHKEQGGRVLPLSTQEIIKVC